VLKVDVRRRHKSVDSGVGSSSKRVSCARNILFGCTTKRGNRYVSTLRRDCLYCNEIAFRSDGEPGLDDVHAQFLQLHRHANFLGKVHRTARRLLAIT
jgi:hypothetical protein